MIQEGRGAWSNTADARTAAVPPDSPSIPILMGSNRISVRIRWQAPEADGGSPVSSYEVELRPKSKAALAGMADEWLTVYQVSSIVGIPMLFHLLRHRQYSDHVQYHTRLDRATLLQPANHSCAKIRPAWLVFSPLGGIWALTRVIFFLACAPFLRSGSDLPTMHAEKGKEA